MTKKLDPDLKCLKACVRHIDQSTSRRMEIANVEYLYDRYVRNPTRIIKVRKAAGDSLNSGKSYSTEGG